MKTIRSEESREEKFEASRYCFMKFEIRTNLHKRGGGGGRGRGLSSGGRGEK
jgi:hypothetical protein